MSSPFILNTGKDRYTVTWPTFHDIRGNLACFNLLKYLFDQIKLDEATLLLDRQQMVTINASIWYSNGGEPYSEWLMSHHDVTGVVFKKISQAEKLREELEKRYMWKILKT